jgi:methylmalonyl-CoA/ethylmalonyl-CoA epimerase
MKSLLVLFAAAALAVPVLAQSQSERDPGFKTITQVAVVTQDVESSAKRWAALLGVEVPKISTTPPGSEVHMMYEGKSSNSQAKLAFLKAGQVTVELIQPLGPNTSWMKFLSEHGEGVHHIAFNVQNLAKSEGELKALGYDEIHRGRWDGDNSTSNGTYVYFDSTKDLGLMIELLNSDPKK